MTILLISCFLQFIATVPLLQADLLPEAAASGGQKDTTVHAADTPQVSSLLRVKYLGNQTKKLQEKRRKKWNAEGAKKKGYGLAKIDRQA